MPERRAPPPTDEGWYALHDFRSIDWDAWTEAPDRVRDRALQSGIDFLDEAVAVSDADAGASAVYSILGHKADLLILHLRPTTAATDTLERRFETTDFARFTEQTNSYVSVTEASGYSERARSYFEDDLDPDSGLAKYIRSRLYPTVPDAGHVCFYPMDKRREPEQNWYALDFEDRAAHMAAHGEIGRDYGGQVTQMITGSIGLDDWEWGVTLWADDLTDVKDLLYEMRFDPSTAEFAEFGSFYVGRRFPPADLAAVMAGEPVPTESESSDREAASPSTGTHSARSAGDADTRGGSHGGSAADGDHPHADTARGQAQPTETSPDGGDRPDTSADIRPVDDIQERLATLGLEPEGQEGGEYAVICYSEADATELAEATDDLAANFDHYDRHVGTFVRAQGGQAAAVSIWTAEEAAQTAAGFMGDLPGVTETVGGPLGSGDNHSTVDETGTGETEQTGSDAADIREQLADNDVYAGQPHGEDVYALVLYSEADPATLFDAVDSLRENFDHYDTHVKTAVYEAKGAETAAVVSIWETQDAAETASGYLEELPEVAGWADEEPEGFATMGMFYQVKPEHRDAFVEKFDDVGAVLTDMEGHRETSLLANREDENDMFIASRWDTRADAMEFFRSEEFSQTVSWGRDILASRPRHVFLA